MENPKLKVFGDDFLRRIGMANAGAVRKALQRLMDHSLVYKVDDGYRFSDSFFRQWILKESI